LPGATHKTGEVSTVELVHPRCAFLDVAKDEVVACVRVPDGQGGRRQKVRTFPTFTSGLEALAGWLAAEGVTQVVMEATGQYWDQLATITGVGKRAAETIIAEIGVDMTVVPTAAHLAWWAGRCPGNNRTGGKRRSGKPTRGNRWLGEMLIECAWAAARSRDTYLSAQLLAAGPTHRQEEGGHGRGALDPGDRLAPTRQWL
jgi:transposase